MTTNVAFETTPVGADTDNTTPGTGDGSGSVDLSVGETEIISFDMNFKDAGVSFSDTGIFSASTSTGSIVADSTTAGTFTYTHIQADWVSASSVGTIDIVFSNSDTPDTTTYTLTVTCFAAGSLIAIPGGEKKVETLRIGDTILTADGREVAVKWLGEQTVDTVFSGPSERLHPVRICAEISGRALICASSQSRCGSGTGLRWPPTLPGLTEPVRRASRTHFTALDGAIPNRAAALRRLSPASTAAKTRDRQSSELGLAIHTGRLLRYRL